MKKASRNCQKENFKNLKASFLDLDIDEKHREFEIELYNKTDAVLFSVVRMLYWGNNRVTRSFYVVVGSEVSRLAKTISSEVKFQRVITSHLSRMNRKGC